MNMLRPALARSVLLTLLLSLPNTAQAVPILFSAGGADAASIQATVDAFRTALGPLNPNVAMSFPAGRREINWDGVPDMFSSPNAFPANFFNINSPRGVVFATPGSGFQVSANAAIGPVEFGNINATYPVDFQTFSPQKLFTAIGSTVTDVNFLSPGSSTPGFVSGFGAVFTDVDLANTTTLQMFDLLGGSLGTFSATPADNGLSFLGVIFSSGEQIGRVRITSGNTAPGPNDSVSADVAVMDDFVYSEPQAAVPEPAGLILFGTGLLAIGLRRRRK